jgi:4a-hydroxytetrahydrobiopterin dehydratase
MTTPSTAQQLAAARCVPCEGGIPKMTTAEVQAQLAELSGWEFLTGPDRIRKTWTVKNFMAGMEFFQRVAELAESERHHPDLHLSGYRNVAIEIWTHAIQGLSVNDFILAARIDTLPIRLRIVDPVLPQS